MLPGLLNDEKKIAALIVSDMATGKEKRVHEPMEDVGLEASAEEIMQAFKSQDAASFKSAMETFIELVVSRLEAQEEAVEEMEDSSLIKDEE